MELMDAAPRDSTPPSGPEPSTPRQSSDATRPSSIGTRASSIGTRTQDITRTPRTAAFARVSADLSSRNHGRSMSAAETVRRKHNSFSLTFPVNATALHSSPASSPTRHAVHSSLPETSSPPVTPTDSTFLTALAAQERRVLELREELSKAEGELKRLKQEWALHQSQRKRHDINRLQKLQPLNMPAAAAAAAAASSPSSSSSPYPNVDDDQGISIQQELERRKTLLNGTKPSNRTVFSGSRHTRTLSLLSPIVPSKKSAPPPMRDSNMQTRQASPTAPERRPKPPARVPTNELLNRETAETADAFTDLGLPRDVLVKTGKQMATDFRDGLWTFIEDLRQATVGDESINGTTMRTGQPIDPSSLRKLPSRTNLKAPPNPKPLNRSLTTSPNPAPAPPPARSNTAKDDSALLDLGTSFWRENGVEEPKTEERSAARNPSTKRSVTPQRSTQAPEEDFTSWDNWESPPPHAHHKPTLSSSDTSLSDVQTSTSAGGTSPRTSISSKRDSIPWPALTKLAPSSMRRTASNLMADWEKSLSPPVDETGDQIDYTGRATSPATSLSKDRKAD